MGMTLEQMQMLEPTDEQLWRRARLDYEGGASVGLICSRYGLARATVYQRAQVWRAQSGVPPHPDDPPPNAADLVQTAWRRFAQAVEAGRLHEALCWRTVLGALERRAASEAWAAKVKGLSLKEASDKLIAKCEAVIADDKAMKADEEAMKAAQSASLDTLPPGPDQLSGDEEEEPVSDPESVRAWRAWAAVSDRLGEFGGFEAAEAVSGDPRWPADAASAMEPGP